MTFQAPASLNISAEEARRLVNRQVVTKLGTGMIARDPELTTDRERVVWRVTPFLAAHPNPSSMRINLYLRPWLVRISPRYACQSTSRPAA